jgi:ABC-type spermidine/putrescine transport system permease subunit I
MKKLKIAAFVSVLLFVVLHVMYDYIVIIENGGVLNHSAWILKQYEMLSQYVAIPIVMVYLYKRLK